nr:MAG: DUF2155 domain-containing protein [Pseudomonadota bacterium]
MRREHHQQRLTRPAATLIIAPIVALAAAMPAAAERIENRVAVFAALDKVTARIKSLPVPLNETVRFGNLKITPRVCYSRPPTEPPKTTTFVEVDEVKLDGQEQRIFTGWMFAESPGLNAVEHPVFDVWLTGCQDPMSTTAQGGGEGGTADSGASDRLDPPRRRIRR